MRLHSTLECNILSSSFIKVHRIMHPTFVDSLSDVNNFISLENSSYNLFFMDELKDFALREKSLCINTYLIRKFHRTICLIASPH